MVDIAPDRKYYYHFLAVGIQHRGACGDRYSGASRACVGPCRPDTRRARDQSAHASLELGVLPHPGGCRAAPGAAKEGLREKGQVTWRVLAVVDMRASPRRISNAADCKKDPACFGSYKIARGGATGRIGSRQQLARGVLVMPWGCS